MRIGVRAKLVLISLLILVVVSFGFTLLGLHLSRTWVEEDLRERAVFFARELAATIGDHHDLTPGPLLDRKIQQIMKVRRSVLQLDIVRFASEDASLLIATSRPQSRLPFTPGDTDRVQRGRIVSRLVKSAGGERHWEVMAPITLDGVVVAGVAAKFSLGRFDAREGRARTLVLLLTAASVLVMGLLMGIAVHWIVKRPIGRFMRAIDAVARKEPAAVNLKSADEFGVLGGHFDAMIVRTQAFNEELRSKITAATEELERRYHEVERLHELLFATQRNLSHAERLALSGRIMAEVAHEVGTPLHSVMGHLELLREDLARDGVTDGAERRLTIIGSQLRRVTEIISQLLDLTRRPPEQKVSVDLNRIVRETSELVRPVASAAGVSLHVDADAELPRLVGHGDQLQQVVLNLLTNAMDATPRGGRIDVATRGLAGEVTLEVSDTGCGIGEADRKRIFDPFFSTKEPGRGTGLGLFISAEIVRDHRGRIELEGAEGKGSTFRVVLPLGRDGA
ncbi:MAG TPA: ATP-binding protein [Candidatus Acidoferrum sp.]|nr:ATP-binding protein [Candidatus Acidoferrum sp.]